MFTRKHRIFKNSLTLSVSILSKVNPLPTQTSMTISVSLLLCKTSIVTTKLETSPLKVASYTKLNLSYNGTNVNESAAVSSSLMSGLTSFIQTNALHQSKSPSHSTILQGHHCCILGFAPLKKIMIGLKKYKQARVVFSSHTRMFSQTAKALKQSVGISLAMRG